jgi:TonB family protein
MKRCAAAIALILAVCAGPWGCAHSRNRWPSPASDEVRAQFKTIGLPAVRFLPDTELEVPGKGWGTVKGAVKGLVAGVVPGLVITAGVGRGCHGGRELGAAICGMGVLFGLGVTAVGGTVGALGGAVYGAVIAESGSRIRAVENSVRSTGAVLTVHESLRDELLRTAMARSSLTFVALDDHGPIAVGETIDYRPLASEGIDTIVEVSVPRIRLAGTDGINPPVGLFMTARAKVIRTADGAELYAETFEYHSDVYKLVDWGADDGGVFRREVNQGVRVLAENIARVLSPLDPARDSAPVAQRAEPVAAATAPMAPSTASAPSSVEPARPAMPASPAAIMPAPATVNPETSDVSTDPRYTKYLEQVRQRIQAALETPCVLQGVACEYKTADVTIEFGIGQDGRVAFINVLHPSPWSIYDEYAVRAIRLAAPFLGVPKWSSRATSFAVRTTFKYFAGYATPTVAAFPVSDFGDAGRPKSALAPE